MQMKVLYKAGYLIRVTSWENDGDNYKTKEIQVADELKAKAIVKFVNLFGRSCSSYNDISNLFEPDEQETNKVTKVLCDFYEAHNQHFDLDLDGTANEKEEQITISDFFLELAYILGLSGGDYYTRYCEKVEVFYFPHDVLCEDVTADFNT